jgi:polar amino acid transport system substrate-binding protein
MSRALALLLAGMFLTSCGLPRDPARTSEFVRGAAMRVGVVHNPPWVIDDGARVDGVEARLAASIAAANGTRIEWVRQPEFVLMDLLLKREIQLAIGGFEATLPWAKEIAFTRPYVKTPDGIGHVLAVPPGENAWLLSIDRILRAQRASVPPMLAQFRP